MHRIALWLGLATLFLSSTVFAAIGTVTLKSGKVYERVTYVVDYDNKALLIESGGWIQRILPERIESVVDMSGTDVTAHIKNEIQGGVKPDSLTDSTQTNVNVSDDSITKVAASQPKRSSMSWNGFVRQRKPFDVAFSARGNFAVPFGDYYEGLTSGLGFEGDIKISLNEELSLLFMISRSGIRFPSGSTSGIYGNYPYVVDKENWTMRATRYYFGLQETKRTNGHDDFPNLWYIWFTIGAVSHSGSGAVYYHNAQTNQQYVATAPTVSDTRFAQCSGAGYIARLGKDVGIDFSASFEGIWTKEYYNNGSSGIGLNGFTLNLNAGLIFMLGAKPN